MKFQVEDFVADIKGLVPDDMSDEDFFNFCQQNADLRIERDSNRQIFILAPTGFNTGKFNTDIITDLNLWNRKSKTGLVFDSSTGFQLPDGAVFSPDTAWLSNEKIKLLPEEQKSKFATVCPDFVIELKSFSDNLNKLKNKMLKWIENGAELAWLIDPQTRQVFIYKADGSITIVQGFDNKLSGENVMPGFEFDLRIFQ